MKNSTYTFINTFRTEDSIFELYKNDADQFKTIKTVQGSYVPEEQFYDDADELICAFPEEITKENLLG